MKKYGYRLSIGFLVYWFFRLTQEDTSSGYLEDSWTVFLHLLYAVFAIMIVWEIISRSISYWKKRDSIVTNIGLYKISLKAAFLVLPLVFIFTYFFSFYLNRAACPSILEAKAYFWNMSAKGFVISLLIISYEIIKHYIRNAVQSARETEIIQKELIAARFEGLKNQVNPHFLFNSFSVLSSLVETDSKKAVEFISKLSDMYRYILENDERMLVSISEELAFLDDYIFLLEMRHAEGIVIQKNLSSKNLKTMIPPMSLQILVENAVKHNAFSPEDPLVITIHNEGEKFIVVENKKREKNDLVHSTGIGLKNLSKRLALTLKKGLEVVEDSKMFRVKLPINVEP